MVIFSVTFHGDIFSDIEQDIFSKKNLLAS